MINGRRARPLSRPHGSRPSTAQRRHCRQPCGQHLSRSVRYSTIMQTHFCQQQSCDRSDCSAAGQFYWCGRCQLLVFLFLLRTAVVGVAGPGATHIIHYREIAIGCDIDKWASCPPLSPGLEAIHCSAPPLPAAVRTAPKPKCSIQYNH